MCLGNNFDTFFASTCMYRLKGVEVCCSFWVYLSRLKRIIKRKRTLLHGAQRGVAVKWNIIVNTNANRLRMRKIYAHVKTF